MISAADLKQGLKCSRFGERIHSLERIDSTNTFARSLAADGAAEGTVVVAEEQTAGKGRQGRRWLANRGENLTFSLILRPSILPNFINLLPLGVAVAVAHGLQHATSLPVYCKWPNDLLLRGKKVAGILMEGVYGRGELDFVVVGIGINVNQVTFPVEVNPRATSLALHLEAPVNRIALLRSVLESLEEEYDAMSSAGFQNILPAWLELAPMIGTRISADMQGTTVTGMVSGVTPEGALVLHTEAGDRTLFAGDVTILDMESHAPRN